MNDVNLSLDSERTVARFFQWWCSCPFQLDHYVKQRMVLLMAAKILAEYEAADVPTDWFELTIDGWTRRLRANNVDVVQVIRGHVAQAETLWANYPKGETQ